MDNFYGSFIPNPNAKAPHSGQIIGKHWPKFGKLFVQDNILSGNKGAVRVMQEYVRL